MSSNSPVCFSLSPITGVAGNLAKKKTTPCKESNYQTFGFCHKHVKSCGLNTWSRNRGSSNVGQPKPALPSKQQGNAIVNTWNVAWGQHHGPEEGVRGDRGPRVITEPFRGWKSSRRPRSPAPNPAVSSCQSELCSRPPRPSEPGGCHGLCLSHAIRAGIYCLQMNFNI